MAHRPDLSHQLIFIWPAGGQRSNGTMGQALGEPCLGLCLRWQAAVALAPASVAAMEGTGQKQPCPPTQHHMPAWEVEFGPPRACRAGLYLPGAVGVSGWKKSHCIAPAEIGARAPSCVVHQERWGGQARLTQGLPCSTTWTAGAASIQSLPWRLGGAVWPTDPGSHLPAEARDCVWLAQGLQGWTTSPRFHKGYQVEAAPPSRPWQLWLWPPRGTRQAGRAVSSHHPPGPKCGSSMPCPWASTLSCPTPTSGFLGAAGRMGPGALTMGKNSAEAHGQASSPQLWTQVAGASFRGAVCIGPWSMYTPQQFTKT